MVQIAKIPKGFCDDPNGASYSWFEASVRRRYDRHNLRNIPVCWNRVGNPQFYRRTAERSTDDYPWAVHWKPWLEALLPGDVIELVPKAIYPGWLNIVRQAEIKFEYIAINPELEALEASEDLIRNPNPLYEMPLDPLRRQTRVLAIQPGSFDDPLVCQMLYVDLGNDSVPPQLEYDALSYVCGPPGDRTEIEIRLPELPGVDSNKRRTDVTRSSESAIRRLRDQAKVVNLWVDCACINEDDNDERSQQVRMIGTIFSRAQIVHVWLGPEHAGIQAALQIIRDACNIQKNRCEGAEACNCHGTSHTSIHEIELGAVKLGSQPSDHDILHAVYRYHLRNFSNDAREYAGGAKKAHVSRLMSVFFDHPYFSRIWTVQEVLKSQTAWVHCGADCVTWSEVQTIGSWLSSDEFRGMEPHVYPSLVSLPGIWLKHSPFPSYALHSQHPKEPASVLTIFLSTLDLKATDPRDKLYAILSLASSGMADEDNLPEVLRPNYKKSVSRVFADFTRWWICRHKSLEILSMVHCHRSRAWQRMGYTSNDTSPLVEPSWAIPFEGFARWTKATLLMNDRNFHATGDTSPDLELLNSHFEKNPLAINLSGYKVGAIQSINHMSLGESHKDPDSSITHLQRSYHILFDPGNIAEHWKTSTASAHRVNFRLQQARARLFDHILSHSHSGIFPAIDPLASERPDGKYEIIRSNRVLHCIDPCIFTTADGVIGLCPWTAKKGDVIVLLFGGKIPYLLRSQPSSAEFSFVGECFVKGIMHGEFLREQQEKRVEPEVFSIS